MLLNLRRPILQSPEPPPLRVDKHILARTFLQATTGAYNSTHKQIKASLEGVVGPGASAATATVLVLLLLLVPGAAVVLICKRIKVVFSLQVG